LDTVTLPGGCAVTTAHRGGLDSLAVAYLALFSEIDRLGGLPRAPVIEEYVSPAEIQLSVLFTMES
jgi:effector-binding domain-containing protein